MPKSPETPKIPAAPENTPFVPEEQLLTPQQAKDEFKRFLKESAVPKERPRPVLDPALVREIQELSEGKIEPDDFEETTKP